MFTAGGIWQPSSHIQIQYCGHGLSNLRVRVVGNFTGKKNRNSAPFSSSPKIFFSDLISSLGSLFFKSLEEKQKNKNKETSPSCAKVTNGCHSWGWSWAWSLNVSVSSTDSHAPLSRLLSSSLRPFGEWQSEHPYSRVPYLNLPLCLWSNMGTDKSEM